jgi:hypothetical protein
MLDRLPGVKITNASLLAGVRHEIGFRVLSIYSSSNGIAVTTFSQRQRRSTSYPDASCNRYRVGFHLINQGGAWSPVVDRLTQGYDI